MNTSQENYEIDRIPESIDEKREMIVEYFRNAPSIELSFYLYLIGTKNGTLKTTPGGNENE